MGTILTNAQTYVSGGIYSNTTWTKVNSPYIVTDSIVLFPGKTLTIEPGVQVKFDGFQSIEIRGALVAIGTSTDSISFISNTSSSKNAWYQITVLNATQNAQAFFEYCIVKNSYYGVTMECCGGTKISYIKNSFFDNNDKATSGYSGGNLPVDNCVFTNNTTAITQHDQVVSNSLFTNNGVGISCDRAEVRNCVFQNNESAIDWNDFSSSAIIDSCTIINNNLGIRICGGPITNSNISNNIIGLITGHTPSTINGIEYYVPIKNNSICNNTLYNIKNKNSYNKNITENCFCTTDSVTIENKFIDGYDSITLGLFNYDIYDSMCQNLSRSVYKVGTNPLSSNTVISKEPNISISPNPFNDFISIRLENQPNQLYSLRIYNTLGQTIQQFENINSEQKTIDCGNFKNGIYLLQIKQNGIIIGQQKLVKQ